MNQLQSEEDGFPAQNNTWDKLPVPLAFIIGLAYGANALTFAAVRQSFPLKEAGIVSGFANTGGFLSAVLLPSIFGKVLDHFQDVSGSISAGYYYGFITSVIFSMVGLVGVILLKEKRQLKKAETSIGLSHK
ncbi:hypothetical protein DS031_19765 [Bacillus taeanensis]|uniref:Major facilitator superfamily (MFS) profile domain-containing protein n=1 Tax=Bacillus taeanensis TaxID=273032 RepID=A0A366XVE5_9BACI|nr:hypothetical protein DS031_19765 [Bacillus taeanensis]